MPVKNAMTAEFLRSAYGGESMAHMRYLSWADRADKESLPMIARLFRAVAYAEQVHANNHFNVLGGDVADTAVTAGAVFGIKDTAENLMGGIMGEDHEIDQMYPVYLKVAEFQEEKGAVRTFKWALEAEKIHAELFHRGHEAARSGKDVDYDSFFICTVCGHTAPEKAPDFCPVCGARKEAYKEF